MKRNLTLSLIFFVFISLNIEAKDTRLKFGSVNDADVKMTLYDADTAAHAVILNEFGETFFDLTTSQGAVYRFSKIKRVKILTKEGLDYASFSISLYQSGTRKESISAIKGFTYNDEDGKVVKTKLEKSSIHRESTTDNYTTVKINFPNVKPGSVVELKYSISSNLFGKLHGWKFQYSIPVRESEFKAIIPEYFYYKTHLKGYETMDLATVNRVNRDNLDCKEYHWKATNVPAFKSEPFMLAKSSFLSSLDFEIAKIEVPGALYEDYSSSWESVKTEMLSTDGIGREMSGGSYLKNIVADINAKHNDEASKVEAAFKHIQNHMKWNERYSTYYSSNLRKSYSEKEGNSADINLLLTLLLQKLGIESHPVLVCSRGEGLFNMYIAKRSSFDYLISTAVVNGKEILLDATDRMCICGNLPFRCLNSQGLKIAPGPITWIDLSKTAGAKRIMCNINLSDLDDITGMISYNYFDYSTYLYNKGVEDLNEDEIIENFEDDNKWLTVTEYERKESAKRKNALGVKYQCEISDCVEQAGDLLYITPLIIERQKSNPFTLKDRKYPVDFGFAQKEDIVVTFICPEGYEVETLPKTINVTLPDNSGSFVFMANQAGSTIQILSKVYINKPVFNYDEYQNLKEFFSHIVDKQAEMVVLKKSS